MNTPRAAVKFVAIASLRSAISNKPTGQVNEGEMMIGLVSATLRVCHTRIRDRVASVVAAAVAPSRRESGRALGGGRASRCWRSSGSAEIWTGEAREFGLAKAQEYGPGQTVI
jgi:hypothetical protein